jgi:transketolase
MKWAEELIAQEAQGSQDSLNQQNQQKNAPYESVEQQKVQVGISEALIECAEQGLPIISLSADLQGSTGLASFHKKFPENYVDLGIAESNMVSAAAGMARNGLIPIVDTFAAFGVTKGNLPLMMANLSQSPVIAVFSHTGFQDAADGASHQNTTYFSAVNSIPNTDVIILSTSDEAKYYMTEAVNRYHKSLEAGEVPRSTVFFLGREKFPQSVPEAPAFKYGRPQLLKKGNQALLVASGPTVFLALKAAQRLEEEGIHVSVVNHSFVSDPDIDFFKSALEESQGKLVVVEDHQIDGGVGSHLVYRLAQQNVFPNSLLAIGQRGHFGRSAYNANQLYEKFQMGVESIIEGVKAL